MAISVVFNGELCHVIGRIKMLVATAECPAGKWVYFFELEGIEAAEPNSYQSNYAARGTEFFVLPSTISDNQTEWREGVRNGQTK